MKCPECTGAEWTWIVRGESRQCAGCQTAYSSKTGRRVKTQQKHGALSPNPARYVRGLGITTHGNLTIDVDDDAARLLRGCDPVEMYKVAAEVLQLDARDLREQYRHLNIGMQRMSLGNRMRKVLRR